MMLEPDQVLLIMFIAVGTLALFLIGHFLTLVREQLRSQPDNQPADYLEAFRAVCSSNSSNTHPSGWHH